MQKTVIGNVLNMNLCNQADYQHSIDLEIIREWWVHHEDKFTPLIADFTLEMSRRFMRSLIITHPEELTQIKGRGIFYFANHQVAIESLIFILLMSAVQDSVTSAIVKQEHIDSWIGKYMSVNATARGAKGYSDFLIPIHRGKKESLLNMANTLKDKLREQNNSVLVHVEGTRSSHCGQPVVKISTALIEYALTLQIPIVPVKFTGGLPTQPGFEKYEFPYKYAKQDLYIGKPIMPDELESITAENRKTYILSAINALGPHYSIEKSNHGDHEFADLVMQYMHNHDIPEVIAVFRAMMEKAPQITETWQQVLNIGRYNPLAGTSICPVSKAMIDWLYSSKQQNGL